MKKYKISIGADHAGFSTKQKLIPFLKSNGWTVVDLGTDSEESTDYPDYASRVGHSVARGRTQRGILACGTGIGMAIAANKVKGIRAAVCWKPEIAALAAQHNWANVLCVPSRFVSLSEIKKIVMTWLNTANDLDARHARRVKKIAKIEPKS